MITTYFMILSSESIHSACASFFMVAHAENQYSVLVLIRAWAIWGTSRSVTNILVGSYATYVLILLALASYGANHDSGRPPSCFSFTYSLM
jgi:hypothetical protein